MVWAAGHSLQNGKYVIQDVLGQGGFGITYKALHLRLNTLVVIKTPNEYLKFDPNYDKYVQRFIKEGQMLAQFSQDSHPHIVRAWDLFEEGEIPCILMDFVPGENLFQLVRRKGALPEAESIPYIRQIGEALAVIHQRGLVHRDAHPGNIIVRPDTRAILIDFGIAKEVIPSTQSSTSEAGNPGFAPYEQISKGSREPAVDVYCLAATLYFAVTGERPVTSLDRRLHDAKLIAPKQHKPLSEYINQAILKGMALEAKDRPQSMRSWLDLLQEPIAQPFASVELASGQSSRTESISDEYAQIPFREAAKASTQPNRRPVVRSRLTSISWISLVPVVLVYITISASLAAFSAPLWAVVVYGVVSKTLVLGGRSLNMLVTSVVVYGTVFGIVAWAITQVGIEAGVETWVGVGVLIGVVYIVCMNIFENGGIKYTTEVYVVVFGAMFGAVIGAVIGAVAWVWTWAGVKAGFGAMFGVMFGAEFETFVMEEVLTPLNRFHTFLISAGTSLTGLGLGWLIGTMLRSFAS